MVHVFTNGGDRSTAKSYRAVSLFSVDSKIVESYVINKLADHVEKCGLFSDIKYGFSSSRSTLNLPTAVSERIARDINIFGATQGAVLDI